MLYLIHTDLLDLPILYLSRYINSTKQDYYRLLQKVFKEEAWEEWVLYMLLGVEQTANDTLKLVHSIRILMYETEKRLQSELPKIYSQDLLNNLFRHPYTRIKFLQKDLLQSRQTARKYLKELAAKGFVEETKIGRNNYYVNTQLVRLFLNVSSDGDK